MSEKLSRFFRVDGRLKMTMGREIVTIQLGHCANHVGTHFWNAQAAHLESDPSAYGGSEIDHHVLYRTGETQKGEPTFTPRLVICDLKGSLGTLRPESELYEPKEHSRKVHTWSGNVERFESDPLTKNKFLSALDAPQDALPSYAEELSKTAQVWSDFNSIYYHPNTVFEIPTHMHGDDNNRFLLFTRGREVFDETSMADLLLDTKIRAFMEESDNPQGFQILADVFDGFSGISASIIESLQEDYPKKARVVFGISPPDNGKAIPTPRGHRVLQDINRALTLQCMSEASSLYLPLKVPSCDAFCEPGMLWNANLRPHTNMYEWSGYLAAGIETATMPFRTSATSRLDMHDLAALLNPRGGTTTAAMSMSLPLPLPAHQSTPLDSIFRTDAHGRFECAYDLTMRKPFDQMGRDGGSAMSVFRGAPTVMRSQVLDAGLPAYTETQINEFFSLFERTNGPLFSHSSMFKTPFLVTPSFPRLFDESVGPIGLIGSTKQQQQEPAMTTEFGVYTRLHTGPSLASLFIEASRSLHVPQRDAWAMADFGNGSRGLYPSDFAAVSETLREIAETYDGRRDFGESRYDDGGDDSS